MSKYNKSKSSYKSKSSHSHNNHNNNNNNNYDNNNNNNNTIPEGHCLDESNVLLDYISPTQRFSVLDPEQLQLGLTHLDEHGYTVISDVLDKKECDIAIELVWKHLENLSSPYKINRNNPDTFNNWVSNPFTINEHTS